MIARGVMLTLALCAVRTAIAREPSPELAYLAVADGYWEVWVSRADGANARQLTHSTSDKTRVSWYPDGRALLASCNDGAVVRIDMEGRETRIPLEQFPVIDAVVSPDGRRVAYSFSSVRDGNDIWIARADGSAAEKVASVARLQHEPSWSPDGGHLYFLSGDGGQAHDIWRISLDRRVSEQVTVGNLYHFDVAVSATGAIAFSSNRSGNYEIYVQPAGGKSRQLTDDPGLDAHPAFSPDGRRLVFESTRAGVPNLWRLDIRSRATTQVTHHTEGARAPAWYQGGTR